MKTPLIILLFLTTLCHSQSEQLVKDLDSVTNFIEERLNIKPGTSIIITKDNKTLYTASTGLSNIALNTPNTIDTRFDLASIAKMFTGYSIAALEVEGKIAMDDDIRLYLKDFPKYEHTITVGHLVHHTSGIKNWTYLIGQMGWSSEDKISTDQLLRAIYAQKHLDFIPGERYQYCNSGYVLLTKIVEVVTGQSFVSWTDEHIFKPLGMDHTFFNDNQNTIIEGMASAYRLDNDGNNVREAYNTSALGSSSLISNAVDMGKWMNFLLAPPKAKAPIIATMFRTAPLNNGDTNAYAYGIEIDDYKGTKTIGHDGSWASFTSNLAIIPDLKLGIFFANNFRISTQQVLNLYLSVFFPEEKTKDKTSKQTKTESSTTAPEDDIVLTEAQLDKFTGVYKLGEAWYLDITRKGTDLYTKATGEGNYYMKPVNDSTFTVRAYGNRAITFKTNADGKVDGLLYDGIDAQRKTTPFYFDKTRFETYEGVYYSTELDVLFTIDCRDDSLWYTNIKTGNYPLFFEREDFFFSEGNLSKIQFDHDASNQIRGFSKKNSNGDTLFYFKKAN